MDQDWDMNEILDDRCSYIANWLNESIEKYVAPTAPPGSVYIDQKDGDCWYTSNNNIACNGGATVTNQAPQHLQVPQTPAHAPHGSLSTCWENISEFEFEISSILQNPSCDSELENFTSPNPTNTGTFPTPILGKPASAIDSTDTGGISFPLGATSVQAAPQVDASLGRTHQILSPVAGNSSPATLVPVILYPSQDQAASPSPAAQISNELVWRSQGFVVQSPVVNQISEGIKAAVPCSKIQVNFGSIPETLQKSDKDVLNPQKSSKKISLGRTQRKKKPSPLKTKLHEVNVPYIDVEKERKRQNAIKARKNRERHANERQKSSDEIAKLRKQVQERDATIEILRRQRQQERGQVLEYHRSELRRLEEEEQAWSNEQQVLSTIAAN